MASRAFSKDFLGSMSKPAGLIQIHAATLLMGLTGLFGKFLDANPFVITGGRTIVGSLALLGRGDGDARGPEGESARGIGGSLPCLGRIAGHPLADVLSEPSRSRRSRSDFWPFRVSRCLSPFSSH